MEAAGKLSPLIGALMDAASLRHRVVSENLANLETPGFRARAVKFDAAIEDAVRREGPSAARGAKAEIVDRGGRVKADGNDVNMERELGELNRNALAYDTLVTVLVQRKRQMQSAISGRSS